MSILSKIDRDLEGAPNKTLTYILVGIAIAAVGIAFFGSPTLKVIAAAWFIAP